MTCSACTEAEADILGHKEVRAGCISCAARALAQVYSEYPPELVRPRMFQLWPITKDFTEGRKMYWAWVKRLNEAKEKA